MKNTEMTDRLEELMNDSVLDIIHDLYDGKRDARMQSYTLEEVDSDTDDGVAFGNYKLHVNGEYLLTIDASGVYAGFQDCADSSGEHYTKDVVLDDLQDFEYEIVSTVNLNEKIDQVIEVEIDHE